MTTQSRWFRISHVKLESRAMPRRSFNLAVPGLGAETNVSLESETIKTHIHIDVEYCMFGLCRIIGRDGVKRYPSGTVLSTPACTRLRVGTRVLLLSSGLPQTSVSSRSGYTSRGIQGNTGISEHPCSAWSWHQTA